MIFIGKALNATPIYNQTAIFAQDAWKLTSKVSLSLGLRWEVHPPPTSGTENKPYSVLGDLSEPATLSLSAPGAPLWKTAWYNFAPRLGVAWQARSSPGMETIVRAGGGVFFDTDNEAALQAFQGIGFATTNSYANASLPISAQQLHGVCCAPFFLGFNYPRHLPGLPYTLEWSVSAEQGLGKGQTLSLSYVASSGRRLKLTVAGDYHWKPQF